MAKTAQKNHSAVAEAGPAGNTPQELARLVEIDQRLADLAADPAIEQEESQRQALVDEDAALRQLAQERYSAPDFSYKAYLDTMTPAQAKRFCDEVDTIGVLSDEESQRLEEIRVELDAYPLPSARARATERKTLEAQRAQITAAPGKRKARREAQVALESAAEIYSAAAEAMKSLEEDMAAMLPRLREIQRQTAVARHAEVRGKELAQRAGFGMSHLIGEGVRRFDGVAILHLFERVAKSVTNTYTDELKRTIGPKGERKSDLIAARAQRCILEWVNPNLAPEFEGEDDHA